MLDRTRNPAQGCPLDELLRLLGRQWTPHILWFLGKDGPTRFGALRRRLDGISAKVLTERLRALEEAGVIDREQTETIPPQVTYSLTARGQQLAHALDGLQDVAAQWHQPEACGASSTSSPGQ